MTVAEKKLDRVFSEFIRLRDSDDNGICKCISCQHRGHWKNMENGHYMKRQHKATRWSEMNCNGQCNNCNWQKQGNDIEYQKALVKKYGEDKVLALEASVKRSTNFAQFEIEAMIKYYSKEVSRLKKEKCQ